MEFNYKCFHLVCDCLQLEPEYKRTTEYLRQPEGVKDMRELINAKKEIKTPNYQQVFQEKKGFIPDLSILDLMFNEGPNALNYLQNWK